MTANAARESSLRYFLWGLCAALVLLRLPSLVAPAGGDQGLYAYEGQRVLAGDVPYRDVWDQKPPAIMVVYAVATAVWPRESVVALLDFAAALAIAACLVMLGRRRFGERNGLIAAAVFLLFGHPALQSRLGGLYVRGQCEPFVACAVAAAMATLAVTRARPRHFVGAGACLAVAFWLKYNAIAYVVPIAVAAWAWQPAGSTARARQALWISAGFLSVGVVILGWLAAGRALSDLWLATITYNLAYSGDTYAGIAGPLKYVLTMPVARAQVDFLWFLGGLGSLALVIVSVRALDARPLLAWVAAAVVSIAINGQRGEPNYFVQAAPALAIAAAVGLTWWAARGRWAAGVLAVILAAGLCRVGVTEGWVRLAELPSLVQDVGLDLEYLSGRLSKPDYLARFAGAKYDALAIEDTSTYIRSVTQPDDPIYVFGFLGGSICWRADRASASRFFWSYPVIVQFAADRPGYGPDGVLADLVRRPPALVILQSEQWQSAAFFLAQSRLHAWLESGYVPDRRIGPFAIWRKRP